jgi:prepilin-type processing-associated H-X9-DG protein
MIRFVCECGRQLQAREDDVGKKAKCPSCNRIMTVPSADARPRRDRDRVRRDDRAAGRGDDFDDYDDYDDYDDVLPAEGSASGQATAALVVGLISLCLPVVLPAIFGLILGILALRAIAASGGRIAGRGQAIAGIATSGLSLLVVSPLVLTLVVVTYFGGGPSIDPTTAQKEDEGHLKKIGDAFHAFSDTHNKRLPQAVAFRTKDGQPGLSWRVALLPQLGQEKLYRKFKLDEPWDGPTNRPLLAEMPDVYLMPGQTNDRSGQTYYQVFVGPGTLFEEPKPGPPPGLDGVRLGLRGEDATDGMANTILVTAGRSPVPWTRPEDLPFDPFGLLPPLSDRVPGGFNILFGDGSARFLPHRTTPDQTLKALITRNGGEVVNVP